MEMLKTSCYHQRESSLNKPIRKINVILLCGETSTANDLPLFLSISHRVFSLPEKIRIKTQDHNNAVWHCVVPCGKMGLLRFLITKLFRQPIKQRNNDEYTAP